MTSNVETVDTEPFRYRADIDGLRAVAVLLVLFFHADLGFRCGFVGVDVFFVISGFLITGLILKERSRGTFSLKEFWLRRIRRILPASSFVVFTTLIVSYFVLLPDDYEELAESAVAQQFMVSNVFFWLNTGYFAGDAELKPLLHTWSLAVEEQFYLGYPFLFLLLQRFSKSVITRTIMVLAILSCAAYQYGVIKHPSVTFYLLPTRAWELLLGGLLCFIPSRFELRHWQNELLSAAGLAGIIVPAACFDRGNTIPGLITLVPCLAAAFLIQANSASPTLTGRLLSAKPIVFVGLISYSLYLWHWPVLTLLRHIHIELYLEALSKSNALLGLGISAVLAILSWRFVEQPFRRKSILASPGRLIVFGASTILTLVSAALGIMTVDGIPRRFDPRVINYLSARESMKVYDRVVTINQVRNGRLPLTGTAGGDVKFLLWGDSHAMCLVPAIEAACKNKDIEVVQATRYTTAPLLEFDHGVSWNNQDTSEFCDCVFQFCIENDVDVVILAAMWSFYESPGLDSAIRRTVQKLHMAGITTVVVLDVAEQKADVPLMLSAEVRRMKEVEEVGIPLAFHRQQTERVEKIFRSLEPQGVVILDPSPFFLSENDVWRAEINGDSLYTDRSHLSLKGSQRLTSLFADLFNRFDTKAEQL